MLSKIFAAAAFLGASCLAQTPTCGLVGWDTGSGNLGYYSDSGTTVYSNYTACNDLCTSNTACLSFAYDPSVACILYGSVAEGNVVASSTSPWTFFDRGGVCPASTTTSSTVVTSTGAAATATCSGLVGYDAGGSNIGYYSDATSATYSGCLALCDANTACLSFGLTSTPACILYDYVVEGNDIASPGSGNTFYDRGGACPSTTASSSTSVTATSVLTTATPTCTGLVGYDAGGANIGYYSDATSATYSGCLALCNANPSCLSFGLTSTPACILYNYTVEGNDIASPGSGNTFYNAGGACPSTTATTTTSATSSTVTTPVQTGAFPNCPSNLVPYNVSAIVTPYMPCNSSYASSACMSDVDGISNYCNLCLSCTNQTCTSDSDCGAGYACIENSDCPVTGATTGTPVCLYMLAGGSEYGCYTNQ